MFHLLKKVDGINEEASGKPVLTGKEVDMGYVIFDLAKYAKDSEIIEKLYLKDQKDMYIEIAVQSKPIDSNAVNPLPTTSSKP